MLRIFLNALFIVLKCIINIFYYFMVHKLWIIEDYLNQNIYLDALYVGFFFFIFVFIILGLVAIYRWCRYDQHRLEQVRKTRIQSPTLISPSDISSSCSQSSPLLPPSNTNDKLYEACNTDNK